MAKRRKRGSGSVHLRKDGRWEGRAVTGYDDKGLPKTKNVLAKTKSECIQKLKDLTASIGKPEPAAKPGMTLGQWLDHWYQSCKKPNLRPNTQMSYEQRIYTTLSPRWGTPRWTSSRKMTSSSSTPTSNKTDASKILTIMAAASPTRRCGAVTPHSAPRWRWRSPRS